jgi:hypothetical protein
MAANSDGDRDPSTAGVLRFARTTFAQDDNFLY